LRRKLRQKGYAEAEIDETLAELMQGGWLSDDRFAESYLRVRVEKGYGPLRIQAELKERGLDDDLIASLLKECAVDWKEQAITARRKHFGACLPGDFKERARQARFLQQRGFSADQVRAALSTGNDAK
jgi:regulatory protein